MCLSTFCRTSLNGHTEGSLLTLPTPHPTLQVVRPCPLSNLYGHSDFSYRKAVTVKLQMKKKVLPADLSPVAQLHCELESFSLEISCLFSFDRCLWK